MKRTALCALLLGLLFFAVWRDPWQRVALTRQFWDPGSYAYGGQVPSVNLASKLGLTPTARSIAARFPADPFWALQAAIEADQVAPVNDSDDDGPQYTPTISNATLLHSYDALIARFPRTRWLPIERLQQTFSVNYNYSQERRALLTPTPTPSVPPTPTPRPIQPPPAPPNPGMPSTLAAPPAVPTPVPSIATLRPETKAMLENALSSATRGLRAEPQNALWYWMRAYCLFQLYRDAAALDTLSRGASTTFYSTHMQEESWDKVNAYQKLRPLDWDEKTNLVWNQNTYAFVQRCDSVTGLAVERAIALERVGRHREALQIYDALTRLLRVRRLAATNFSFLWQLSREEEAVWGGSGRVERAKALNGNLNAPANGNLSGRSLARRQGLPFTTVSSLFADYARAHGRPDLARLAVMEDNLTFSATSASRNAYAAFYNNTTMSQLTALNWLGTNVAWQIVLMVGLWLLLMVLLGLAQLFARRRRSHQSKSAASDPVPRSMGWQALLAAALLPLALSVGIVIYVLKPEFAQVLSYGSSYNDDPRGALLSLIGLALATGAPLLVMFVVAWGVRRERTIANRASRAQSIPQDGATMPSASSSGVPGRKKWWKRQPGNPDAPKADDIPWLPLSAPTMRWLLAPFNWVLTVCMPLSWAALLVGGDSGVLSVPLLYIPGISTPLVSLDAPGWGFSVFLTFVVCTRWVWRQSLQRWMHPDHFGAAGRPSSAKIPGLTPQVLPSVPTPPKRRRQRWNPVPFWRGARDALGVALVFSALLYVFLLWQAVPLRTRYAQQADLVLRLGELRAAQVIAASPGKF